MLGHRWPRIKHANSCQKHAGSSLRFLETAWLMCVIATQNKRRKTQPTTQPRNQRMHANDIAFGIEFETTLARQRHNANRRIPQRSASALVAQRLEGGTRLEHQDACTQPQGMRICFAHTSRCRRGSTGRGSTRRDQRRTGRGSTIRCGLHITVTWNGDAAALARLISLVGNHEKAIFASTGTRRRELTVYSKKIKHYGNKDDAKRRCEADRFHLLNLTHLAAGKNRIEFRAFAGTTNKTKAIGYLLMVLGIGRTRAE